jgi:hypothetical protein
LALQSSHELGQVLTNEDLRYWHDRVSAVPPAPGGAVSVAMLNEAISDDALQSELFARLRTTNLALTALALDFVARFCLSDPSSDPYVFAPAHIVNPPDVLKATMFLLTSLFKLSDLGSSACSFELERVKPVAGTAELSTQLHLVLALGRAVEVRLADHAVPLRLPEGRAAIWMDSALSTSIELRGAATLHCSVQLPSALCAADAPPRAARARATADARVPSARSVAGGGLESEVPSAVAAALAEGSAVGTAHRVDARGETSAQANRSRADEARLWPVVLQRKFATGSPPHMQSVSRPLNGRPNGLLHLTPQVRKPTVHDTTTHYTRAHAYCTAWPAAKCVRVLGDVAFRVGFAAQDDA